MAFKYEIRPGLRTFKTDSSKLVVVGRRAPDHQRGFPVKILVEPLAGPNEAWASLIFKRDELATMPLWRDVPRINPQKLASELKGELVDGQNRRSDNEIETLMSRFLLFAISGLLQTPGHDRALDDVVSCVPEYINRVSQHPEWHKDSRGVLNANLARLSISETQAVS